MRVKTSRLGRRRKYLLSIASINRITLVTQYSTYRQMEQQYYGHTLTYASYSFTLVLDLYNREEASLKRNGFSIFVGIRPHSIWSLNKSSLHTSGWVTPSICKSWKSILSTWKATTHGKTVYANKHNIRSSEREKPQLPGRQWAVLPDYSGKQRMLCFSLAPAWLSVQHSDCVYVQHDSWLT